MKYVYQGTKLKKSFVYLKITIYKETSLMYVPYLCIYKLFRKNELLRGLKFDHFLIMFITIFIFNKVIISAEKNVMLLYLS